MGQNISKYIQINDALLLEYEFNKAETATSLTGVSSYVGTNTTLNTKQYWNSVGGEGITNDSWRLSAVPTESTRSTWFVNPASEGGFDAWFIDTSIATVPQTSYVFDTIKVHIISGYNFDDVAGFLLQVRAQVDPSAGSLIDLANFTWIKQILPSSNVIKFDSNTLHLGNRFYDKYVLLKVPSIQYSGGDGVSQNLAKSLGIKNFGIYGPFPGSIRLSTYKYSDWIDCKKECSPCFQHSLSPCKNSRNGCSTCYDNLNVDEVIERIENHLNKEI